MNHPGLPSTYSGISIKQERFFDLSLVNRYTENFGYGSQLFSQFAGADMLAHKYDISRRELDRFAAFYEDDAYGPFKAGFLETYCAHCTQFKFISSHRVLQYHADLPTDSQR